MSRTDDDDRAAVDRAFAEMVAGYHLTADRPDPLPAASAEAPQSRRGRRLLGGPAPSLQLPAAPG